MTDTPPPPPDTPPPLIMGRSGLVELNIGGKPYTTTRQTLENSGFLRALTSGSFAAPRDAQGRIFVDRDATPAFETKHLRVTCAVDPSSRRSYGYTGDARRAGSHRARVKLSGASGNCVLKGAGREATVYP